MKTKFRIMLLILVALTACGGKTLATITAFTAAQVTAQQPRGTISPPARVPAKQYRNVSQEICTACPFQINSTVNGAQPAFDTAAAIPPPAQGGTSDYKSVNNPNHSVVNAVMTTRVQGDDNQPVDNVSVFASDTPVLYAVVSTRDSAPGTVVSVRWIAVNAQGTSPNTLLANSQVQVEGNVNIAFSLRRDASEVWAPGEYRLQVFEDGEPDGTLDFEVNRAPASTPAAARIARVVTFAETDSAGNPIDLQGEFPAGTKRLGAQVFVDSDAPMEVQAVWWTGVVPGWPSDTKLFQAVGKGSKQQNGVLFEIERNSGEPFPPGTYKLELYVDNKLENTTTLHVATPGAMPPSTDISSFTFKSKFQVTPEWLTPAALVIAPNNDLYVAESGAIRHVTQDLSSTRFGEMGISQGDGKLGPAVTGIAADSKSNLWVANPQQSNIQKFSADGKFLLRFPGDDSNTYDKDGEVNQAYGIAIDKQDNVYVADTLNNRIQKFDTNGKFLGKWANLSLKSPIGITTDAQGNVYVTDAGNHRVVKLDAQGKLLLQFGKQGAGDGEFNGPWGIALDAAGNIFVTDNFNQRVQVFDATGKFLTKFGSKGTGDGQFGKPVGILVASSGNVYVADGENNTVQVFAPGAASDNPTAPTTGQGRIIADLGFRPYRDGFGFENYTGNYPYEQGDLFVEDLIRMFGEQAVCAGFKAGECQVAPGALEWADRANQASNGGHCEGLAVLSLRLFTGKESPQEYGASPTFALKYDNQDLQRAIMYYFAMQTADPVRLKKDQGVSKTPSQVLDDIIAGIQQRDPMVVAIRHYLPDQSRVGHAVAPYAVEDRGNGIYYVWIYDNNAPGAERYIEIDRNANTWKYDIGSINPSDPPEPWGGDADDHTFGAARISVRDSQAECEWCARADSMTRLTLLGGGAMRITNSKGQVIGLVDGQFVNEISGAQEYYVDGGLGKPSVPIYYIPSDDTYEMTLDGSALTSSADSQLFVFGGGKSLNIDNITLAPGEINALSLDGNLDTFRYDPESQENSEITLTVDGAEDDYYFAFDGLDIDVGEALSFTFDETNGRLTLDSNNGSGDDTYSLTLKRIGNDGATIYKNNDIAFGEDDTEYIDYGNWDGADSLSIGVDKNGDGSVDQQLHEVNER